MLIPHFTQTKLRKYFVQVGEQVPKAADDVETSRAKQELLQLKLTVDCLFRSQLFELHDEMTGARFTKGG
jgi:hypothetical protein